PELRVRASLPTRRSSDLRTRLIQLPGHQPRRELHHVRVQTQVGNGLGSLEPQQAPAENSSFPTLARVFDDRLEILDRAVDEHPEDRKSTRLNSSHVKNSY